MAKHKMGVALESALVDDLDDLAEEVDTSRTEVIEELLKAALADEAFVDGVFPPEEPEEGEEKEEESEEESEEEEEPEEEEEEEEEED